MRLVCVSVYGALLSECTEFGARVHEAFLCKCLQDSLE